jgi:membrane protein DedA with SNARE-associated domain
MDFLALFSPEQVEGWFEWGGYFILFGLFGLLFACGLGLPMPEDIPLLAAGYFIAQEKFHLVHACVVAWLGIIGGDCVLYSFGRRYGLNITYVPFIGKHVTKERILRAEELFERWGIWVVAVGRMFAGIRGAMVVAAGAIRFNFLKFLIADGLAALVSGGLFVALGYWAGIKREMREKIKDYEHWVFIGLGVIALGAIGWYYWRTKRQKPLLADVALTKVVNRVHEKEARQAEMTNDQIPMTNKAPMPNDR